MPSRIQRPTRDEVSLFPAKADFAAWMERHHDSAAAVWVGYYRRGVAKPSVSYADSVDVGLAYGWIDSITFRVDDEVTAIRFTPRRHSSNWSAANIARMEHLIETGEAHPAGVAAFANRPG